MLVQTHRLIGESIYDIVFSDMGVRLNKEAFKYGCIRPDIVPRLRAIRHYKDESFDFVNGMISEMQNEFMPKSRKEIKRYSIKLGTIIHYITDYFCSAHNGKKFDSILDHILYERRLARKYADIKGDNIKQQIWSEIKRSGPQQDIEPIEFIEKRHIEYIDSAGEIVKDIRFSLEVCMAVSYYIIGNSLRKVHKKAA